MRRALREQELERILARHDRDHHGSVGHARACRQRGDVKVIGCGRRRGTREAFGDRLRRQNRNGALGYRLRMEGLDCACGLSPLQRSMP
jgi:hypothetical protein